MGRWRERFFEGDSDLDEASYISEDAGIELFYYEADEPDAEHPMGGKGLEATREHLNNGVLNRLFEKYSAKKVQNLFYGKPLRLVHTGERIAPFGMILD